MDLGFGVEMLEPESVNPLKFQNLRHEGKSRRFPMVLESCWISILSLDLIDLKFRLIPKCSGTINIGVNTNRVKISQPALKLKKITKKKGLGFWKWRICDGFGLRIESWNLGFRFGWIWDSDSGKFRIRPNTSQFVASELLDRPLSISEFLYLQILHRLSSKCVSVRKKATEKRWRNKHIRKPLKR